MTVNMIQDGSSLVGILIAYEPQAQRFDSWFLLTICEGEVVAPTCTVCQPSIDSFWEIVVEVCYYFFG